MKGEAFRSQAQFFLLSELKRKSRNWNDLPKDSKPVWRVPSESFMDKATLPFATDPPVIFAPVALLDYFIVPLICTSFSVVTVLPGFKHR